jgi:hypothetical protein
MVDVPSEKHTSACREFPGIGEHFKKPIRRCERLKRWQELAKVPRATVRDTKNIESPRGATGRVTDETDYFRIADKSEIERKQLSGSAQVLP